VDKDMYEIRQTAEGVAFTPWDSAPLVWRGRTDNFQINNIVGDAIGWGIKAIDTSGNYSNAAANVVWSRSYSNILNVQHNFIFGQGSVDYKCKSRIVSYLFIYFKRNRWCRME
jgi:hypothetical protein